MTDGAFSWGKVRTFASAMLPSVSALALQLVAFAITARGLGVEAFGIYTGVLAVSAVASELVGLGAIDLLVRGTARDRSSFANYFGHLVATTLWTWPIVTVAAVLIAVFGMQLPIGAWLLAVAIATEIIVSRAWSSLEMIMVAHGDVTRASVVRLVLAVSRMLLAAGYFLALGRSALEGWIIALVLWSVLVVAASYVASSRLYGRPRRWFAAGEMRAGLVLCLTQVAGIFQNYADRMILTRFASPADVGNYGAASRVLQVGFFPLQVATRMTYPNFFAPERQGLAKGRRYAARLVAPMFATGLLAALAVIGASYFIPTVLGRDFLGAQHTTVLLALALPLIALQTPPADALVAANLHTVRLTIYAIAAATIGFFLLAGAALGGSDGVAIAFVVAHALLATTLWAAVLVLEFRLARVAAATHEEKRP